MNNQEIFFKLILDYFSSQYPNIYMEAVDHANEHLENKGNFLDEERQINEAREFLSFFKLEHLV